MTSSSSFVDLSILDLGLVHGGMTRADLANVLAPATETRDRCLAQAKGNHWETQVCNANFLESVSKGLQPGLGNLVPQTSAPVCERTSSGCFAAGTLVRTPAGARPIEKLGAGDWIVGVDGDAARIAGCHRAITHELVRIHLSDGSTVDSTPWHRFFVARGLLAAESLTPGMLIRGFDGAIVTVLRVETIARGTPNDVYNLALDRGISFYANQLPVEASRARGAIRGVSAASAYA